MEFVIATNNKHKLEEMGRLLAPYGHTVASLASVGIQDLPPETGKTFEENALAKAQAACELCGDACIADDSGLAVDALDGAPGVMSARFAGTHGDDKANNDYLMHLLERTPYARRGASFVCALALVMPDGKTFTATGYCSGRIGLVPSGSSGFGYDPLFFVGDKSFADMTDAEKDAVSHRADAAKKLMDSFGGGTPAADAAEPPAEPQPQEGGDTMPEE